MGMRVLIADDHPLYRGEVSRQIVKFYPGATVAEASSLDQAMALARVSHTGLFILNYNMPGMSAEAIATVAGEFNGSPILVVADQASALEVQAIIRSGAQGYLSKTATREQLTHTIHMLLAGGTSVPAELIFPNEEPERPPAWLATLTPRETDVLRAATRGLSNKEIARELELAEVTVKFHLSAIFRKMNARSRTEAAMLATRAGIT
jgi:two-component system nitrate/nitrite response regulator NarL